MKVLPIIGCVALLALTSCRLYSQPSTIVREDREPEAATGLEHKQGVVGYKFMVATANPYASTAGYQILRQGGSAVDAAIAVQLVLTLVEPQSSGIGGGSFMLHWDKKRQQMTTFDGRETAPNAATPDLFLDDNGQAVRWIDAVVGGRSVGVPGVLASFYQAHQKYGKLPWSKLFDYAIELADHGFIVSPRLERLVSMQFNPGVSKLAGASDYFFPNGEAIKAGQKLQNKALAKVYRSIATHGIEPFYRGWIAKNIVSAVQQSAIAPGMLTLEDMANYQPVERQPVCGDYRQYKLCGMPPPSSGGIAVIQTLAQLQRFSISEYAPTSAEAIHLFSQSSRLAFADRDRYVADSDFVTVPVDGLLSKSYLAERSALIDPKKDMGKATAGQPDKALVQADDNALELPSTSHIAIVDAEGNAVSMTSSIEMAFGSAVMVDGFLLNNQLTDFSLSPKRDGQWVANRLEPGKRPRSSMAPMMAFDQNGSLVLVVGSPGGSRIINYVAQTIMAMLDWQLTPQQAINLPRVTNRNNVTTLEKGTKLAELKPQLEALGHQVMIRDLNSGIQAIKIDGKQLIGGADPRREGKVIAQ